MVSYALEWEEENSGKWTPVAIGSGITDVDVVLPIGVYRFRVAAISLWGKSSAWVYSNLQYALTGKVLTHYDDGSILLNKKVSLPAGKTWYLETYCENPAGPRPANLPVPYRDSRLIGNPVGDITDRIYTSPRYIGNSVTLTAGTYNMLPPSIQDAASFIVISGGNVTLFEHFYQNQYQAGASRVFTPGVYRADYNQFAPLPNDAISSAIVSPGATCLLAQHEPGRNPVSGSIWVLVGV